FAWPHAWPAPDGPFNGVWGVCPFFPSGTLIASDMTSGLYVFRPLRNYGTARVSVIDASSSQPIPGATVTLTSQGDSLVTPSDGVVRFAPNPGTHAIFARKFGYRAASASFGVALGVEDTLVVALDPIPAVNLAGVVRDAITHLPLADAELELESTPVHVHSDSAGTYALAGVPDDDYTIAVDRPGYAPLRL